MVYTKVTPLPSNVPRQLAIDLLHSHEEFIRLNNLVTGVKPIEAPRNAASDEYFSNWYEISEVITWGFGMKKKMSFKGCFHNQPWGMQSHVHAPANTEMRNSYRIGGNQPGEPREAKELGVDTPMDGLYLREDINIVCQIPLTAGFVKKEMQAASKTMVDRMTHKAELLDEGKLHAMFEDGKLKTTKPSQAATFDDRALPSPGIGSMPGSPGPMGSPDFRRADTGFTNGMKSPALDPRGFGRYQDVSDIARSGSVRSSQYMPAYQQQGYQGPDHAKPGAEYPGQPQFVSELPGSFYQPQQANGLYPQPLKPQGQMAFTSELPGDNTYRQPQISQDSKPTPPTATHPAYQAYSQPPQPSPGLPARLSPRLPAGEPPSRTSSNGSYQVTNPDQPAAKRLSSQGNIATSRPNSYTSSPDPRQSLPSNSPDPRVRINWV